MVRTVQFNSPFHFRRVSRVDRLGDIKKLNHDRTEKFHLVSEKWVLKSAEEGMILEERSFALKTEAETENSPSLLLATVF